MNRREFLGRLINYYAVVATTQEHYGLMVPYNYHTNIVSTIISYTISTTFAPIVALYDSNDVVVWANAVIEKPPYFDYTPDIYNSYYYTTIGGVKCYYLRNKKPAGTTNNYEIKLTKPGIYTSRVIYTGVKLMPEYKDIQFEVKQLEKRKNYGLEDCYSVTINHNFKSDTTNIDGIFYSDIPNRCIIYK